MSWNTRTFQKIANQCRGFLEVDRGTETSSILIEANQSGSHGYLLNSTNHLLQNVNNWVSIQLITIFIVEDTSNIERKGKEIQTDGNSDLLQKPKDKKPRVLTKAGTPILATILSTITELTKRWHGPLCRFPHTSIALSGRQPIFTNQATLYPYQSMALKLWKGSQSKR